MTVHLGKKLIYDADIHVIDSDNKEDFMNVSLGTGYPNAVPTVCFETDIEDNGLIAAIGMDYADFNALVNGLIALRNDMRLKQMEWVLSK